MKATKLVDKYGKFSSIFDYSIRSIAKCKREKHMPKGSFSVVLIDTAKCWEVEVAVAAALHIVTFSPSPLQRAVGQRRHGDEHISSSSGRPG